MQDAVSCHAWKRISRMSPCHWDAICPWSGRVLPDPRGSYRRIETVISAILSGLRPLRSRLGQSVARSSGCGLDGVTTGTSPNVSFVTFQWPVLHRQQTALGWWTGLPMHNGSKWGKKPVRPVGGSGVSGLIHGLRTLSGPGQDVVMSTSGHFPKRSSSMAHRKM